MINMINKNYYDDIVDGYNQRYLQESYETIRKGSQPYVLVYMNIKNFRYYNTRYGATQGNELLKLIYHHIACFWKGKGIVSHLFADHFAALLPQPKELEELYKELTELVDTLYRINDPRIYRELFLSYGIYEINSDTCFDDALNLANLARKSSDTLYQRSSCVEVFDDLCRDTYLNHHELEIKTANAYKNYEFIPYLQPKVDTITQTIVGAEVLLRWIDHDGHFVPVSDFLPILNDNGYIELVDIDTFEIICKMLHEDILAHRPVVPISFNISKSYFYDPSIIEDYVRVFQKYDLPCELIEFELMESISLDDTKRLKEVISGFRQHGFHCSLDDFGNGYSSFNVLLNAELNAVKLDRQFFLNNLNGDSKMIIQTVIQLIKSLGMHVIAEGVETKEHVEFLRECDCDIIQGFYFYKPMPLDEFHKVLEQQSTT